ncbi:polyprenol monophosphomannose synthase [Stieleria magnilauensis]
MDDSPNSRSIPSDLLIAICTYQESQNIQAMLVGLRRAFPDACLMVVDDNSPDGTADLVREAQRSDPRIELIVRRDKRGLGSAIVDAMKYAVARGYRFFVNLDADQSHDPAQLPDLVERARADQDLAVVIGSRYVPGGEIVGWPLRRRLMSKLVNRFATAFLKLPVKDCSGSMRCYRTSALDAMDLDSLQCTGYAVLEELLVKLHRDGRKMSEVPITFTERELGHSKLTFAEAVRSVRFMLRLAMTLR